MVRRIEYDLTESLRQSPQFPTGNRFQIYIQSRFHPQLIRNLGSYPATIHFARDSFFRFDNLPVANNSSGSWKRSLEIAVKGSVLSFSYKTPSLNTRSDIEITPTSSPRSSTGAFLTPIRCKRRAA